MRKRILPLLAIATIAALFFAFDLDRWLSLDALARHHAWLMREVAAHPVLSAGVYILLYTAVTALSLPGGAVMTLGGGLLFGAALGGIYAVIGATIGATVLFLIAKTSVGDHLLQKAGASLQTIQQGFNDNALSYMFVLRLVPLFPFFLVNLAPAFLGVPLRVYLIATFFGIMPATFIYALAGSGISELLAQGGKISLAGVLTPQMTTALIGLALLALTPALYKRMRPPKTGKRGIEP